MPMTKLLQVYAYEVFISIHSIVLIKQGERCREDTYSLSQDSSWSSSWILTQDCEAGFQVSISSTCQLLHHLDSGQLSPQLLLVSLHSIFLMVIFHPGLCAVRFHLLVRAISYILFYYVQFKHFMRDYQSFTWFIHTKNSPSTRS